MTLSICIARSRVKECRCIAINIAGRSELPSSLGHVIFLEKFFKVFHFIIVPVVKSRRMRWAGHVARMGEGRGEHRVLVGKPERTRPLGRPRRRWDDNFIFMGPCIFRN
jgi:hypothetical protein